ncbi:MAG: HK97 gp10 family phage protein [Lachnospiraceae bacterium]|nr:HK97 gp10 family phage protein [Lachnospiraceae bacterium]
MASNRVKIDSMAAAIMEGLQEYADLATDDVKKAVKKAGTEVKKQISGTAPQKSGKYAKSWTAKTTKETSNALEVTVHSRNRYQVLPKIIELWGLNVQTDVQSKKNFAQLNAR